MHKILITAALMMLCCGAAAQNSIPQVLRQIEKNNLSLATARSQFEAEKLEALRGNSLSDPEVEFNYLWGSPTDIGKAGEVTAVEEFDFPTVYAARGKLAKIKSKQYASEYDLKRQEVLFEAETVCIDIIALRKQRQILDRREKTIEQMAEATRQQVALGEAETLTAATVGIELIGIKSELKRIDIALTDNMSKLEALNGGAEVTFTDSEFPSAAPLAPREMMLEIYETGHPLARTALTMREVAASEVRVSRSGALPKLALGYKYEFARGERFNGVIAGITIPMFANRGNVKRARAHERYVAAQTEEQLTELRSQLMMLYAKCDALAKTLAEYDDFMKDAEKYLADLDTALRYGHISLSNYLLHYNDILQVFTERTELEKSYHTLRARINSVLL
jgi:outer membrane protein TolC